MRTFRMVVLLGLWLAGSGVLAQKIRPATNSKPGLKGEYFEGPNFERKVMTRTDAQVNFNWNWESPGPGVPREYFSVRWTGKLYAPTTGTYRFSATVDDGVRVWVNGRKVIDEWRKQDDSQFVGEINLKGRQLYDLKIEYYNDWKGSVISVYWEMPEDRALFSFTAKPHQVIPAKYLFNKPDRLPPAPARPAPVRALVMPAASRTSSPAAKQTTLKPGTFPAKRDLVSVRVPEIAAQKPAPIRAAIVPVASTPAPAAPVNQPFNNLTVGEAIVLRHVVFAQSEYTLLPESHAELDRLVRALQSHPDLRVEIAGHTDNVGDKRLNQALSEHRAKVVANYLIQHGIADARITANGYGGSRPVTTNDSEAQRAQNRRVEFIVKK